MPLTVAAIETEACLLVGRLMDLVGLHGAASVHPNPSLNAPIRDALQRMGYAVADPITVADSDLDGFNPLALRRLLEWIELLVLEQIQRDWWRAESPRRHGLEIVVVAGAVRDPLASVKDRLMARLAELYECVKTPYQSMNVPIALDVITRGSPWDPTVPPPLEWTIPPEGRWYWHWHWYRGLAPDAFWEVP